MRYSRITVYDGGLSGAFEIDAEELQRMSREKPDVARNFVRECIVNTRVLINGARELRDMTMACLNAGASVTTVDPYLLSLSMDTHDMSAAAQAQRVVYEHDALQRGVSPQAIRDEITRYAMSLGRLAWLYTELFPHDHLPR